MSTAASAATATKDPRIRRRDSSFSVTRDVRAAAAAEEMRERRRGKERCGRRKRKTERSLGIYAEATA